MPFSIREEEVITSSENPNLDPRYLVNNIHVNEDKNIVEVDFHDENGFNIFSKMVEDFDYFTETDETPEITFEILKKKDTFCFKEDLNESLRFLQAYNTISEITYKKLLYKLNSLLSKRDLDIEALKYKESLIYDEVGNNNASQNSINIRSSFSISTTSIDDKNHSSEDQKDNTQNILTEPRTPSKLSIGHASRFFCFNENSSNSKINNSTPRTLTKT